MESKTCEEINIDDIERLPKTTDTIQTHKKASRVENTTVKILEAVGNRLRDLDTTYGPHGQKRKTIALSEPN